MSKYLMTECRIAEVFVNLKSPGVCRVRLEAVSPYVIEVNDTKCIIFLDPAVADPNDIPAFKSIEFKGGWLPARVYEAKQLEFEVTNDSSPMISSQLLSIKTSRQKIRAWVDFAEKAEQKAETEDSTSDNVKAEEPKLICFTAI